MKATELHACVAGCWRDPRRSFWSVLCRGLAAWAPVDAGEAEPLRRQRADCRVAKKAPGSRLRELEEASEEWRFLVGPHEGLSRSLHWHLAIALASYSSITQVHVNTRKQWPTYLTSGSCTSRHSTIALVPTLTLLTFVPSFVAVSRLASNTSRRSVGQWRGAGGAGCEDHFALARRPCRARRECFFFGFASQVKVG